MVLTDLLGCQAHRSFKEGGIAGEEMENKKQTFVFITRKNKTTRKTHPEVKSSKSLAM